MVDAIPTANTALDNSINSIESLFLVETLQTALLAVVIYAMLHTSGLLAVAGSRLSSTSKLPFPLIKQNLSTLLSLTWPDSLLQSDYDPLVGSSTLPDAIRLVYVGRMGEKGRRIARGVRQCSASPVTDLPDVPFWLTNGSPLTKAVVQLTVWEWLLLWVNTVLVIATFIHNRGLNQTPGRERYMRLVCVSVFAICYVLHAVYILHSFKAFLTWVGAGGTWSFLNRANFAVVDKRQLDYKFRQAKSPEIEFRHINKANGHPCPENYDVGLEQVPPFVSDDSTISGNDLHEPIDEIMLDRRGELKSALETLIDVQQTERKIATTAATQARDQVIAIGVIMLLLLFWYQTSEWIGPTLEEMTNISLSFWSLVVVLGLGAGAMLRSAFNMRTMIISFQALVFLKEIKINGQATDYANKRVSKTQAIGFTHGNVRPCQCDLHDLIKLHNIRDWFALIIFGPAYFLLPSSSDQSRSSEIVDFQITASVRGQTVMFTTGATTRHGKDEDGRPLEPINVSYRSSLNNNKNYS